MSTRVLSISIASLCALFASASGHASEVFWEASDVAGAKELDVTDYSSARPLCTFIDPAGHCILDSQIEPPGAEVEAGGSYYAVSRVDTRKCSPPFCGGYFVAKLNRQATRCLDGVQRRECYVADLDLSALELDEEEAREVRAGNTIFLGELNPRGDFSSVGDLVAHGAWQAPTAGRGVGGIYRVEDSGLRCVTSPCPALSKTTINTTERELIAGVELENARADTQVIKRGYEAIFSSQGLLVAGFKMIYKDAGPAGDAEVLVGTQFYVPVSHRQVEPIPDQR